MRFIILSFTIFFFLPVYSQEFQLKKISTANFKEIYTLNKITKLESGSYLKLDRQSKDTLISGTYLDGVKSGVWRYYSTGNNLWMLYDFDNKSFKMLPIEKSKIDSFLVKKGDSFHYTKVDLPPVYLGSKNEMERIIISKFKVPKEMADKNKTGIYVATFNVDKYGKINEFNGEQIVSNEIRIQLKEAFKQIDGDWSPALVNGEPVDSQIVFVCDIAPYGERSLVQENAKAIVVHFQYYQTTNVGRHVRYEIRELEPMDHP